MSEIGNAWWNLKFEVRHKLSPVLYKTSFTKEQKARHNERFDSLASGLISLLDSDPTEIKRKLGLDEKQMKFLLLLGKLSAAKSLTREPHTLEVREGQRLLSTVYEGSQSEGIDTGNQTLTHALDFLTKESVALVVNLNADGNQPVSAGMWGNKGAKYSDNVHFLFLTEKPATKEHARSRGSYLDLRMSAGATVDVYGGGQRIDLLDTFKHDGKLKSSTETFLYLGEFEWESDTGEQTVHCWGHNTKIHSKTLPIRQEEKSTVSVPEFSKVAV